MKKEDIATLVNYRLEEAHTALTDARFLADGNRSPQSIVNRSYFAMFYAALALLQNIGKVPSKHVGVISLFDKEFVSKNIFSKEFSQKNFPKIFIKHLKCVRSPITRPLRLYQLGRQKKSLAKHILLSKLFRST